MSRALVLTPTIDGRDGLSCLARQFTAGLSAALPGVSLDVWTLTEDAPAPRAGVTTLVGAGGSRIGFAARSIAKMWSAARPDVVVSMHAHLLPVAAPLVWRGAKLVTVLVGVEAWRRLTPLEAWAFARSARVVAISAHTAREFRAANPNLADRGIEVCWPATPALAPPVSDDVSQGSAYALIVGRMSADERYKGHDLLIDIWPQVLATCPDARLFVAGGGDDAARLSARARRAGLEHAVRFLGPVEPARLSALYRDAAMVVMPSPREGFGFVFLEAMVSRRPCIGARGAAEEIIQDGVTGFIVDPTRPEPLVSSITRLFGDPDLRERMGRAGQERAGSTFAFSRLAADLSRLVGPLVAATPAYSPC